MRVIVGEVVLESATMNVIGHAFYRVLIVVKMIAPTVVLVPPIQE